MHAPVLLLNFDDNRSNGQDLSGVWFDEPAEFDCAGVVSDPVTGKVLVNMIQQNPSALDALNRPVTGS